MECGVNASALYHRENYYKEAFELLRGAEQVVATGEQKTGKAMPNLRFRINKERLQMYINLKNPARAKEQLTKLEETAKASHNNSLSNLRQVHPMDRLRKGAYRPRGTERPEEEI